MDGEFPWIYVAMIVIAFVSWVFQRIQEMTAARRRADDVEEYEEEWEEEFEDENPSVFGVPDEQSRAPAPPVPTSAEDAVRKLYEALGGQAARAPEPVEVPVQAPPLQTERKPESRRSAPAQGLTRAEKAALEAVKRRETEARNRRQQKKAAPGTVGSIQISELLKDPNGVRKAVALREILDQPRAFRPWE